MHALTYFELNQFREDLERVARFTRTNGTIPSRPTVEALQRLAAHVPVAYAELVDHRENCVRPIQPGDHRHGWWLRCPAPVWVHNVRSSCGEEFSSHDLLTADRILRHLAEDHDYTQDAAVAAVETLKSKGLIP